MGNEAPETLRASSEPAEKNVFQEFDKHLLIVSEAASALADRKTCLEACATDASLQGYAKLRFLIRTNGGPRVTPRGHSTFSTLF